MHISGFLIILVMTVISLIKVGESNSNLLRGNMKCRVMFDKAILTLTLLTAKQLKLYSDCTTLYLAGCNELFRKHWSFRHFSCKKNPRGWERLSVWLSNAGVFRRVVWFHQPTLYCLPLILSSSNKSADLLWSIITLVSMLRVRVRC